MAKIFHDESESNRISSKAGLLSGAALLLLLSAGAAHAQTPAQPPAEPEESADVGEADASQPASTANDGTIVVTGSRVIQNGNEQPTPVTVISANQLLTTQPTLAVDALSVLPSLTSSTTRFSISGSTATGPGSFLNLRGLGANRTLVLMDGRRLAPSTNAATVDAALLPNLLVQRVDVVTGGASAAYGSDAVSGVVNFVIDARFRGIRAEASYGQSEYGDMERYRAGFAYGGHFADDRLHILVSAEYFKSGGLQGSQGRDYLSQRAGLIPNPAVTTQNPASPSNPQFLLERDVRWSYATFGGLITNTTGPLAYIQFGPGGVTSQLNRGRLSTANAQVGGDAGYFSEYINYISPIETFNAFGRITYEVTPDITLFAQLLYGQNESTYFQDPPFQTQTNAFTIFSGNAFLPANVQQIMTSNNIASFRMGRIDIDWPFITANNGYRTWDATIGANGEIGGFRWEAYYEYGKNHFFLNMLNEPNVRRVYEASDAVFEPGTGRIICHSTLANPNNGCVPLNVFGPNAASPAALAYVQGTLTNRQDLEQNVASLSISGDLFELWAGPVSVGIGGEYRDFSGVGVVDPISSSPVNITGIRAAPSALALAPPGGWQTNNPQPLEGGYHIWEGFGEMLVPLLRDTAFAHSLDLNVAGRITNYSTSGTVYTWKVGLTWEPFADLRVRATRSRDIRAPNILDLFAGNAQSYSNITDPFNNNTLVINVGNQRRGNPNLTPEIANTNTIGIVYQPSWWPGFSASIDYYDIKIDDQIAQLSSQQIVNLCFQGVQDLCPLIVRDQNNALILVNTPTLNFLRGQNRGVDLEFGYRTRVGSPFSSNDATLSLRAIGTYVDRSRTTSLSASGAEQIVERAGDIRNSSQPKWRWFGSISYDEGPVNVTFNGRYIGGGKYSNDYTAINLSDEDNHVPPIFYVDMSLQFRVGLFGTEHPQEIFFHVTNLLNRDPPIVPANNFNASQTVLNLYNAEGRSYTAGVRLRF